MHIEIAHRDMVVVETFLFCHKTVVISESAAVPVQTGNFVDSVSDIDIRLSCNSISQICLNVKGVAGEMEREFRIPDTQTVCLDDPFRCRLCGVNSSSVTKCDVDIRIRQASTVDLSSLSVEVYTLRCQPQLLHAAFYPHIADKSVGVDACLLKRQFVDNHTFLQQRKELDVYSEMSDIGDGVFHLW